MKKTLIKILCIILAIFLLITAVVVIGIGVMTAKGYGITEGRCLITGTGSYMLIDENNSPIEMSNRNDKDLFSDLSSGDEILVIHDGIQESYPAGTGVYYCKKLSDGEPEDIPTSVIESLTELGWLEKEIEGTKVECVGDNYNFSLIIPDGWEYEKSFYNNDIFLTDPEALLENPEEQGIYDTIEFRPVGEEEGQIVVRFDDQFGVCGTGLESKTVYLGEYAGSMGTYDNKDKWSFIALDKDYVIINQSANWWNDYGDEVMEILSTIEYE